MLFEIIIVLLLIFVNGFFSASEMAIVTLNATKLRREADEGDKVAQSLIPFLDDPGNFLATIQVMVTFAGFLSSAYAGDRFSARLVRLIDPSGNQLWLKTVILILITVLISYLSLVFGELVPKRIAINDPEKFARRFGKTLIFFDRILDSITNFLNRSTEATLRLLNIEVDPEADAVTEEEIRLMVDAGSTSGNIHEEEGEMIENIFEFNDKEASEIMTHRTNIVALPLDSDLDECIDLMVNERYSRFPVYDEDIDDIVGILSIKDLMMYIAHRTDDRFNLEDVIREPFMVPESKHVDQLLKEMRKERVSIAIVIDEYGGTAGLVSIEDILEEIVGDIEDEFDEGHVGYTLLSDGTYMVNGLMLLEDLQNHLDDVEFNEDTLNDFDTIAGLVLDLLGYIPDEGEDPTVTYKNLSIQVKAMDDNRIALVQMKVQPMDEYTRQLEEKLKHEEEERAKLEQVVRDSKLEKKEEEAKFKFEMRDRRKSSAEAEELLQKPKVKEVSQDSALPVSSLGSGEEKDDASDDA